MKFLHESFITLLFLHQILNTKLFRQTFFNTKCFNTELFNKKFVLIQKNFNSKFLDYLKSVLKRVIFWTFLLCEKNSFLKKIALDMI